MKQILQTLVDTVSKNALSNVVKGNKELYQWVLDNTHELDNTTRIIERIYYILFDKPDRLCYNGNLKKFVSKELRYGYCGNLRGCKCFRDDTRERCKDNDIQNIIDKRKITWMEKYGVDNVSKFAAIKTKRLETMSAIDYSSSRKNQREKMKQHGYEQVVERVSSKVEPNFDYNNYNGCFRKNFYEWKCIDCNFIFDDHIDYGRYPKCPKCYPNSKSMAETEIKGWLESYGINVLSNVKNIINGEIDLYLPDYNIGIEYNGIYWHSSKHKDSLYHVTKMLQCKEKGIHLIQIFEDEYINKLSIIKSRLLSYLNKNNKTYARNCYIKELTTSEYKQFSNNHHLQGYATASIKIGLFENSELKAVMSFGKSRYTKDSYELIRYCSNGNVIGGASKLFKYFIKKYNPKTIISYANRCWSNGNLYHKLGFTDITDDIKNVGYWYLKRFTRYHRSNFTKKKLVNMGHDTSKTEEQIMDECGYLKIYDCGNYKFIWKNIDTDTKD